METLEQKVEVGQSGGITLRTPWQPIKGLRKPMGELIDLWVAPKFIPEFHGKMGITSQLDPQLVRVGMREANCYWETKGKQTGWVTRDLRGNAKFVEDGKWVAVAWLPCPSPPGSG